MLVQVSKRRQNGSVSAKRIADDGSVIHVTNSLSVSLPNAYRDAAKVGSLWEVDGPTTQTTFTADGYTVIEDHLEAHAARFVKPSTRLLETWLQRNVKGIGEVKAGRLARNPRLIEMIEQRDISSLLEAGVPSQSIDLLLLEFPNDAYMAAINWLADHDLPVKLAASLSTVWREKTIAILKENPFRLLNFDVPFELCRKVAKGFGFDSSHPKYQAALAVDIISQYCRATSSTLMPRPAFQKKCSDLGVDYHVVLRHAMEQELIGYIRGEDGFQLEGEFLLEALTGQRLRDAILRSPGEGSSAAAWERSLTTEEVTQHLHEFEQTIPFSLTIEQRHAVSLASRMNVIALSGGAGTGKTTILQAILTVLEKVSHNVDIFQIALSGRAAQRMVEATGRPASTIAKFCVDMARKKQDQRPNHCIVVIDEASMVDLYSMHDLLRYLPYATRFIFVGDVDQLPPVGGGLLFHNILKSPLPAVELTAVKRQGAESGIHRFATAVRHQQGCIALPNYQEGPEVDCAILRHVDPEGISELLYAHGGPQRCAILTSMQAGKAGVENLNTVMQRRMGFDRPVVRLAHEDGVYGYVSFNGCKFYLNDPILIMKNDYDIGVRNGDLGTIVEIFDEATEDGQLGSVKIDGRTIDLNENLLDKMNLGYAITIHKSQGSQWENVVLVLDRRAMHMLDKTLLYTGATRAQKKLIVCCEDMDLIQQAVDRGSIALQRKTNLLQHLNADF
jgi:exodeoxyribonuclease V alpha subunit